MSDRSMTGYAEFRLRLMRATTQRSYQVTASGLAGEATGAFKVPFSDTQLENFILRVGRTRRGVRSLASPELDLAQDFGGRLFSAVMQGPVGELFRATSSEAQASGQGVRISLLLTDAPELSVIPWEFLYDAPNFLALSSSTPVVRYLDLPNLRPLEIKLPIRILGTVSAPSDVVPLDTAVERQKLEQAIRPLVDANAVTIEWLEEASLLGLSNKLRSGRYHVLHFIGHGGFDDSNGEGTLLFQDENGRAQIVGGEQLGRVLGDKALRLVLLNSSEGARSSVQDPFSGVATSLVQRGIPAVIEMQFEMTDRAAILFASEFYAMLAEGQPVDAAVTEARLAIFADQNDVEWATPVLFTRVADGRLFNVADPTPVRGIAIPDEPGASPESPSTDTDTIQVDEIPAPPTAPTPPTPPPVSVPSRFRRSGYSTDRVPSDGKIPDHLRMELEVDALSWVVSARDVDPPLSIGLFGAWGTGKSTFMQLMQNRIDVISSQARQRRAVGQDHPACEYIRQITFNAWHYADSNLWASLVTHIFEELARAPTGSDRGQTREEYQNLVDRLETTRALRDAAEMRKALAATERTRRIEQLDGVKRDRADHVKNLEQGKVDPSLLMRDPELRAKANQLASVVPDGETAGGPSATNETVVAWLAGLLADPKLIDRSVQVIPDPKVRDAMLVLLERQDVREALTAIAEDRPSQAKLAAIMVDPSAQHDALQLIPSAEAQADILSLGASLTGAYREVLALGEVARDLRSIRGRIAYLVRFLPSSLREHRGWIAFGVGAFAIAVVGIVSTVLWRWGALEAVATLVTGVTGVVAAARSLIKDPIRKVRDAVDFAVDIVDSRARRQIDLLVAEEIGLQREIDEATKEEHEAERELEDIRQGRRLYRYIEERAKATDYKPYLGIIAQIRKDFTELARLMDDGRLARQAAFAALATLSPPDAAPIPRPASEGSMASGPNLDLPAIDRVVLYIDDLDRCPADRVVQVLEAVHLLLALKLFVVVVGVDPRWLMRSLRHHYTAQLSPSASTATAWEGDRSYWDSTPANYLEKIFQIPFSLRRMTSTGYKALMADVFQASLDPDPTVSAGAQSQAIRRETGRGAADQAESGSASTSGPPTSHGGTSAGEAPVDITGRADGEALTGSEARSDTGGSEGANKEQPDAEAASGAQRSDDDGPERNLEQDGARLSDGDSQIVVEPPQALRISGDELRFIQALGAFVPTPRAAKRLANTYRLVRVLPAPTESIVDAVDSYKVQLTLLAILIGFPHQAGPLFDDLVTAEEGTWGEFKARAIAGRAYPQDGSPAAPMPDGDPAPTNTHPGQAEDRAHDQSWERLARNLDRLEAFSPLPEDLEPFREWALEVGRFSFEIGEVSTPADDLEAGSEALAPGKTGHSGARPANTPAG